MVLSQVFHGALDFDDDDDVFDATGARGLLLTESSSRQQNSGDGSLFRPDLARYASKLCLYSSRSSSFRGLLATCWDLSFIVIVVVVTDSL